MQTFPQYLEAGAYLFPWFQQSRKIVSISFRLEFARAHAKSDRQLKTPQAALDAKDSLPAESFLNLVQNLVSMFLDDFLITSSFFAMANGVMALADLQDSTHDSSVQ